VLIRGLDDWVDAAEVAWVVKDVLKLTADVEIRRVALEVIADLILQQLMTVGDVTNDGFSEWSVTPVKAVERIRATWSALVGLPRMGDICWLANTSDGNRRARQLTTP
jgi:hypothetical protein